MTAASLPHRPVAMTGSGDGVSTRALTFDDVYEAHAPFVWRSVCRLGVPSHAADDAVQDIFLVVHRRVGEFEQRASVTAWLYAIVIRVVRQHRRTMLAHPESGTTPASVPPPARRAPVMPSAGEHALSSARATSTLTSAPVPALEPSSTLPEAAPNPAARPAAGDDLRPQLAVLHRMRLDLTARRGAEALALYRANQGLFVGSALEPEARVALIAALCLQGRGDEANRESAALSEAFPSSPLAHRSPGCANSDSSGRAH